MMKKTKVAVLLMLSSLLLLPSCHFVTAEETRLYPEGSFDRVTEIRKSDGSLFPDTGTISIAVLTDVHVGRELNDSGVIRHHENFYDFYSTLDTVEEEMPIFLLGDISDSGADGYFDLIYQFLDELRDSYGKKEMPIIYIPGNHELSSSDFDTWYRYFGEREEFSDPEDQHRYGNLYTVGAYSLGNILIESTNNAQRLYTRSQLEAIEYNLQHYGDDYAYKLILSHIPQASEKFDQSLFWYVMADADERNEMLRLMYEYGPSFNMVGHLHEGAQFNEYSDRTKEFIFSSFHKRDVNRDNGGYWHIVDIDQDTGDVDIYAYDIETKGITKENCREEGVYSFRKSFNMNTITENHKTR